MNMYNWLTNIIKTQIIICINDKHLLYENLNNCNYLLISQYDGKLEEKPNTMDDGYRVFQYNYSETKL